MVLRKVVVEIKKESQPNPAFKRRDKHFPALSRVRDPLPHAMPAAAPTRHVAPPTPTPIPSSSLLSPLPARTTVLYLTLGALAGLPLKPLAVGSAYMSMSMSMVHEGAAVQMIQICVFEMSRGEAKRSVVPSGRKFW